METRELGAVNGTRDVRHANFLDIAAMGTDEVEMVADAKTLFVTDNRCKGVAYNKAQLYKKVHRVIDSDAADTEVALHLLKKFLCSEVPVGVVDGFENGIALLRTAHFVFLQVVGQDLPDGF